MISKSIFSLVKPLARAGSRHALKYNVQNLNMLQQSQSLTTLFINQPKRGLFGKKKVETEQETTEKQKDQKQQKTEESDSDKESQTANPNDQEGGKQEKKAEETLKDDAPIAQKIAVLLLKKPEGYEKQIRDLVEKNNQELQLKTKTVDELVNKLKVEENTTSEWVKKVDILRKTIKEQEQETELVRKRYEKQIEDAKVFAISKFAKDLLDIPDNFERALESVKDVAVKESPLYEGVNATYKILLKTFEKHGIVQIHPIGEKFNPNHHEALYDYDDPNSEPGSVGQVAANGYLISERVLRPAKVGVIRKRPQ